MDVDVQGVHNGRLRVFELTRVHQPFGWENLELRYGGLRARLDTMQDRISCFLDKDNLDVTDLPELEVETQPIWPGAGLSLLL